MKITILIITVCLMQVSALTKAQISIDVKQESLRKVLEQISQQSGYDFVYNAPDFKEAKPVDLKLNNVSLEQALQAAFYKQPLIYEVSDKTVMIRKKDEKSYLETLIARFQAIDVRGVVLDSIGGPLAGATISVKGSKRITNSEYNGTFNIKAIDVDAVLVISYLGYITKEVKVNRETMFINLIQSNSKLDEVQIIAYGSTTKRYSTGNVATIKAEDIEKQNVDNPLLTLSGRIAGLSVTPTSGLPGAGINVQLRGQNSLGYNNASGFAVLTPNTSLITEPLYVVDNVPYTNNIAPIGGALQRGQKLSALSFLNLGDIESIDVLKDGDATAIYGSRGANGVILITTKKGKAGAVKVDINASTGAGGVTNRYEVLNTQQYLKMRKDAYRNDNEALPTIPSILNYDLTLWDQNKYTNWQKRLLGGQASINQIRATLSGGSPAVSYFVSGAFNKQGYVFPGGGNNKSGNVHFNLIGISPNQKLRTTLTASYNISENLGTPIDFTSMAITFAPNSPDLYKDNGDLNWQPDPNTGRGSFFNPFASLQQTVKTKTNVLNLTSEISYKISSGLTVKSNLGLSGLKGDGIQTFPFTSIDPTTWNTSIRQSFFRNNASESWSLEPQIIYNKYLNNSKFDIILGGSFQSQNVRSGQILARGFSSDALMQNLASASSLTGSNTTSQYRYSGIFGRFSYNLQDKFLLNLSARRDGSSRFGPNRQFGNFGSLGAAWMFSNEKFFERNLQFLSFGKLRVSYGISGNENIGDYKFIELYQNNGDANYPVKYQNTNTIVSSGVTNPYYSWETTGKFESGIELGFLKDRIILSTVYFRNRSSNQLGILELPKTAGNNANFVANQDAKIQNSGVEFLLNTANIQNAKIKWNIGLNLSIQRNRLLAIPTNASGVPVGYGSSRFLPDDIGNQFSGFMRIPVLFGVDEESGRYVFLKDDGSISSPGNFAGLQTIKLSYLPKFTGGVNSNLSYKAFSLDLFFQVVKQKGANPIFDSVFAGLTGPGSFYSAASGQAGGNLPVEYVDRWKLAGDVSYLQRVSQNDYDQTFTAYQRAVLSDYGYVDASFIRLKTVSITYDLSNRWLKHLKLNKMKVFVQGQNMFTMTSYKGLDPEIQSLSALPQLRVITGGLQVVL